MISFVRYVMDVMYVRGVCYVCYARCVCIQVMYVFMGMYECSNVFMSCT